MSRAIVSSEEQAQILVLNCLNLPQKAIVKLVNWSRAVLQNFLKDLMRYKTKGRSGAPFKTYAIDKRNYVRQVDKGEISANEMHRSLHKEVSAHRVQ